MMPQSEGVFDISYSMEMILNLVRAPGRYSGDAGTDLRDIHSVNAAVIPLYENARRLLQDLIYLKRSRNSLRGYGSLPGQILLEIFRWCLKRRESVKDPCYAFSQVCHWWRVVAISEKTLWTTPDLLRPNLAIQMFKDRTADLPLHVYLPDLYPSRPIKLSIPRDYNERIQSIDISYSNDSSGEPENAIHWFLKGGCFSILKSLSLKSRGDYSKSFLDVAGNPPLLSSVTLVNCLPCWNSGFMRNLTSLSIVLTHCVYNGGGHCAFAPILSVLKENPNLRELVLENVMHGRGLGAAARLTPPTSDNVQPLELAHLESLKLTDDIDNIAPLLPLLKIPLASTVKIQANMVHGAYRKYIENLSTGALGFLRLNQWTTKSRFSAITFESEYSALELNAGVKRREGDSFVLCITGLHYREPYEWSGALANILLELNVEEVHFWGSSTEIQYTYIPHDMPKDHLCIALSKLPTLKTLWAMDDKSKPQIIEDLITALEPRTGLDAPNASQTFIALKMLCLYRVEIFEGRSGAPKESMFQELASVIGRRREAGQNVPSVWLKECSFVEPDESLLASENVQVLQPCFVGADACGGEGSKEPLISKNQNS